jgi:hypothetical protein
MLKTRSSLLIAGGSMILLLSVGGQDAGAGLEVPLTDPFPLVHNAQISSCQYRHPDGSICALRGHWPAQHYDNDCRCVRLRVIQGGGGTPGTVEVRRPPGSITGAGGTPGTVEVRRPD